MKGTDLAPEGTVFVCGSCGKTSRTRYGFIADGTPRGSNYLPTGERVAGHGWDESCSLNAILCYERSLGDGLTLDAQWRAVEPQPEPEF